MPRKEIKHIDISNIPELLLLAKEVKDTKEPVVLRQNGEDLATLSPITKPSRKAKTKEDYEAFRSAFGGWKDVDTDKLIADIYADRAISDRPPVDL